MARNIGDKVLDSVGLLHISHIFLNESGFPPSTWVNQKWMKPCKSRYHKKLWFFVLEINWLAARDTPFSSSKTTCNISATSCWVLKSKGTPLKLDSLRFKAHKKLDGSTGLLEFFFTVMLRLMARNIGDRVLDSVGLLHITHIFLNESGFPPSTWVNQKWMKPCKSRYYKKLWFFLC